MRGGPVLAALLGLCAAAAGAEAQSARVERRGAAEAAAQAGEPLALPFRVTNLSGVPAALPGVAELPAGWRVAGSAPPRPLAPGEAELRLVGVGVPASAAAGRHVVRYRVGEAADSAVVVVAARRGVAVEPLGTGGMVIAGDAYAVRFRVMNRGNVAERLAIRAEGDRGLRPEPDSAWLTLPPAGEAVVTVRARTQGGASLRHQVTLRAGAEGAPAASARTMVWVVPRGGARVPRPRLPAELRVRADDSLSAASFAVSAAGALDRAGRVRLYGEARTADPAGAPFARQDEYRLRLDGPGWDLRLGDEVYALSRLTEPGRYGFGAGASLRRGWLRAGGFVSRDRRGEGRGGTRGGFARLGGDRAALGLAFAAPDSAPARWTVQAQAAPHPLLRVEAEAAPAAGDSALPRALHLRGAGGALSYDLLHLRGGPSRGGAGRGDQDAASVTLRPFGELALSAAVRRGGDGLLAPDSTPLPRGYRRAGIAWGSRLSVEVRQASAGGAPARGEVRSLHARLGLRLARRLRVYPAWESGRVVALDGAAAAPFRIVSLQSSFAARGASLWAQVQLRDGPSAWEPGDRAVSGSLSAHLPVLPATVLRFSGQGRRIDGGALEGALDAAVERTLPGGHRISVRALAVAGRAGGGRPRMYLEYGVPLGVPLPARGADGVTARVVDARTGRGMPDVLVRVGDRAALTDRNGTAVITGLSEGAHLLRVEGAAGTELVADRELPVPLTVGEGGAARVEVRLQPAARLAGRVLRASTEDDTAAVPMAGVRVRISGSGVVHHAVTDAAGRFEIGGVRPGWWRVGVDPASLPRHHELAEEPTLLLGSGRTGEARLRVVERERPVQMIQGGDLTVPP
jgi:hypothetical protein